MNVNRTRITRLLALLLLSSLLALSACSSEGDECSTDNECPAERPKCIFGECQILTGAACESNDECMIEGQTCVDGMCIVADGDTVGDGGGGLPSCTDGVAPSVDELRINEIHAGPASGEDDADCDGTPGGSAEEFIEIVNNSDKKLLLDGVILKVTDDEIPLSGCLDAGTGLVVFTNDDAMPDMCMFNNIVASSTASLGNSGETVTLDLNGTALDSVSYPSVSSNNSWSRIPDFTGEFANHSSPEMVDATFSAGTCVGGQPLVKGCLPPGFDACGDGTCDSAMGETEASCPQDCAPPCMGMAPAAGDLLLNEIHAGPDNGEDDVNCDSVADSNQDEFIEIVNNNDSATISLENVEFQYRGETVYTFSNICLAPGRGIVLYNRGIPTMCNDFLAVSAETSFTLANSGDTSVALVHSGTTLDSTDYVVASNSSWTRVPDFTGEFQSHNMIPDIDATFSVGKCVGGQALEKGCSPVAMGCGDGMCDANDGETEITCPADCAMPCMGEAPAMGEIVLNEIHAGPDNGEDDVNCDSVADSNQDEFVEIVNTSSTKTISLEGVEFQYRGGTEYTFGNLCLQPGTGVVLYNRGIPPMCTDFTAVTADSAFTLANSGDTSVALVYQGTTLDATSYEVNANSSWTRVPDFTGAFQSHNMIPDVDATFSVGKCVSGQALMLGCMPTMGPCGDGMCDTANGETEITCPADCAMPCNGAAPMAGQLLINEVHPAPANNVDDVNCDSTASSNQDEFIEIVNASTQTLSLNNVEFQYRGATEHTFGDLCLEAGRGIVLYNRGIPAMCTDFTAVSATSAFTLANSGDTSIALVYQGTTLDATSYEVNANSSWTRVPDFTGTFERHDMIAGVNATFSVGKCVDGSALQIGCMPNMSGPMCGNGLCETGEDSTNCLMDCPMGGPMCGNGLCETGEDATNCAMDCMMACAGATPGMGDLLINEIHAGPLNGTDDVNCDSVANSNQDEFIEIVNNTMQTVSLQGVEVIRRSNGASHTFGNECLGAGEVVVLYNRGVTPMCTGFLGIASSTSIALTNGGDTIGLELSGTVIDEVTYPSVSNNNSHARDPDFSTNFVRHSDITSAGGARFSVGTCADGAAFPSCQP